MFTQKAMNKLDEVISVFTNNFKVTGGLCVVCVCGWVAAVSHT